MCIFIPTRVEAVFFFFQNVLYKCIRSCDDPLRRNPNIMTLIYAAEWKASTTGGRQSCLQKKSQEEEEDEEKQLGGCI